MHFQDLHGYAGVVSVDQNQVKVLHILNYRGTGKEFKYLEHFIEKLEFLELVEVNVVGGHNDKILQTKMDLMMLPTVYSSNCQIQVLYIQVFS